MTVAKLKGATMELEIKELEKAVCNLTNAVMSLTAAIKAQKFNGYHTQPAEPFMAVHNDSMDVPKTVCSETHCGVINSETITCDHTLERYQSEYNCG
jgi:hypothetical protein